MWSRDLLGDKGGGTFFKKSPRKNKLKMLLDFFRKKVRKKTKVNILESETTNLNTCHSKEVNINIFK